MTILIAHRGNVEGPNPARENHPDHVQAALDAGFDAEVDVWWRDDAWFLGHDKPQYEVSVGFLIANRARLWCHAKNLPAMQRLRYLHMRSFFHDRDAFVWTSSGHIWAHMTSDLAPCPANCVMVMPEASLRQWSYEEAAQAHAICTDYPAAYAQRLAAVRRTALLISGCIACWRTNLLPQLERYRAEHPDEWVDVFVSANAPLDAEAAEFVRAVKPAGHAFEPFACDPRYVAWPNVRPEYDYQRHLLGNFVSHLHNNRRAMAMAEAAGVPYERVVLFRTDIQAPALPALSDLAPDTIYSVDRTHDPAFMNNEVLIGDPRSMGLYARLVERLDHYIADQGVMLHPETLSGHHIRECGIEHRTFRYAYALDPLRRQAPAKN